MIQFFTTFHRIKKRFFVSLRSVTFHDFTPLVFVNCCEITYSYLFNVFLAFGENAEAVGNLKIVDIAAEGLKGEVGQVEAKQ